MHNNAQQFVSAHPVLSVSTQEWEPLFSVPLLLKEAGQKTHPLWCYKEHWWSLPTFFFFFWKQFARCWLSALDTFLLLYPKMTNTRIILNSRFPKVRQRSICSLVKLYGSDALSLDRRANKVWHPSWAPAHHLKLTVNKIGIYMTVFSYFARLINILKLLHWFSWIYW